jgi:long-chain fatty acid transport protein
MKRKFKTPLRHLCLIMLSSFAAQAQASDFNIPFISTSGLGDMYAGWAVSATDASTAFTNPAGLTKIHNMQLVGSLIGLQGYSQFRGTANTIPSTTPVMSGTASTQIRAFIPTLYFAMPIARNAVLGFSQNTPFALGTSYPTDSVVRYAATRSHILVMDVGPSIGFKITDKLSGGIGLDFDRMTFTLNQMKGFPTSVPDAQGQNHLTGWGYGFHAGLLYDITQATRVGIDYNSQVMFHTTGDSESFTPTGTFRTTNQRSSAALPTLTQLSIQQDINPRLTVLGTAFYSNWRTFNQLTMRNTMQPNGTTMAIAIPFEYHNTFDYSVGLNFKMNPQLILKTGVQILNTPSNNRDRSVPDPIGSAIVFAFGAHYQQSNRFGYDMAYAHSFFKQTAINHTAPLEFASGNSNQATNILGLQITWNIA